MVRYHPGEKYEPHHDLFDLCDFPQASRARDALRDDADSVMQSARVVVVVAAVAVVVAVMVAVVLVAVVLVTVVAIIIITCHRPSVAVLGIVGRHHLCFSLQVTIGHRSLLPAQKPRRHLTFLIYLNDMPDEHGGHTTFPRLNLRIRPKVRG